VVGGMRERRAVDVRPDRRGRTVLGPDVAVGKADLATRRALAALAAQPQELRRHGVSVFPVEARVASDDGRNSRPAVVSRQQLMRYLSGVHVNSKGISPAA